MNTYPKPDWRSFFKTTAGMAVFLVALHWTPEIATWIHAAFFAESLVINERRFRAVLLVADAMAIIAILIHIAGLTWAWWHNRKV